MTLPASTRYTLHQPTSTTTNFLVNFPIFSDDDIEVYVDGEQTLLYSVTSTYTGGVSNDAVVVLNVGVTGVDVEIFGTRSAKRNDNYLGNSAKLADNLQLDLDRVTASQQEVQRDLSKALRIAHRKDGVYPLDESAATRANRVLTFSEDGLTLESGPEVDDVEGAAAASVAAVAAAAAAAASAAAAAASESSITRLAPRVDSFIADGTTSQITIPGTYDSTELIILSVGGTVQASGGAEVSFSLSYSGSNTIVTWLGHDGAGETNFPDGDEVWYIASYQRSVDITDAAWASRAALVSAWSDGLLPDGTLVSDGAELYIAQSGATDISDLPGLYPKYPVSTLHFPNVVAARSWSETNQVLVRDFTGDPNGSQWRIGANPVANENTKFLDAAFSIQRTKFTTGIGDHAIGAILDLNSTDGVYAAGYALSGQAYTNVGRGALGTAEPGPEVAGVRGGARIYDTTTGQVRGAIFEASLPLDNAGAADGTMTGAEIAVKNFGGAEVSNIDTAQVGRKVNIFFAQGGADAATNPMRNTAMMFNGVSGPGWIFGWTPQNIHTDYINASLPQAAGARMLNIRPDANWDDSVIVMPEGTGLGAWDAGETTVTDALTMDATTAGAVAFPVGIKLAGGADLLDTYEEGIFTPVLSDGTNDATQSAQHGFYTRIGNLVDGYMRVVCTDVSALSGSLRITDLPYVAASGLNNNGGGVVTVASGLSLGAAGTPMTFQVNAGTNQAFLYTLDLTTGTTALQNTEVTNSVILAMKFSYRV